MARVIASPKCALEFHTRIAVKEIIVVIKVSVTECCLLLNVVCPSILDSDELITRFLCCFYFFICSVANTKFCFFSVAKSINFYGRKFCPFVFILSPPKYKMHGVFCSVATLMLFHSLS